MLEYIIAGVLIILTLLFLLTRGKSVEEDKKIKVGVSKSIEKIEKDVKKEDLIDSSKIAENKKFLINSFREGKDLIDPLISRDGKTILFHDDKKIMLGFLNHFEDKNPKFLTKSVEQDVISDAAYSEDQKIVVVGLKNSKQLVFYEVIKDENNKQKLNKLSKSIQTTRKYEIKNVIISKDGNYVATSGKDQDTLIQIYEVKSGKEIGNIDTNEIKNVEMKMTPDDNHLTISTFMREIAVVEYKKTVKFNKAIDGDETTVKIQRNKSLSGIKIPIDYYDFSNDNKFFVVSCDNAKIKIFQNFGNFEESKIHHEFQVKEVNSLNGDKVSLYVSSINVGKLNGFVALSHGSDIYLYDVDGNFIRVFKDAHDSKINLLKLVKNDKSDNPILISASRDGRFHIWNILN